MRATTASLAPVARLLRRLVVCGATAGLVLLSFSGIAGAQNTLAERVSALSPQVVSKLGADFRALLLDPASGLGQTSELGPDGMVRQATGPGTAAYVLLRGDIAEADLTSLGVRVLTHTPLFATAFVPLDALPEVLALPSVEGVELPHPVEKHLNVSAYDMNADDLWGRSGGTPPTYSGYSGKNVLIGIVDTGLDLTHDDFKTTQGKTRVKYLWDQSGVGGTPPTGYNYGVEWNNSQLDLNLALSTDIDGHGTHITGIAAGDGSATGLGKPAYRYVGVAPEANLIIVRSILTDLSIVDGVKWIFSKATALNQDAVVLIAAGNQRGAHDGGADLDRNLSVLTGPGHLIVSSVGNSGGKAIHSRITLASSGSSGSFTPSIPAYAPSNGEYLDVQAWHASTASFQVKVTTPSGLQSAWLQPGGNTGTVTTADGAYFLTNDVTTNAKGRKMIQLYAWYQGGTTARPKSGVWKIDVQRLSSSTTGQLDAWIAGYKFGAGALFPTFTTNVDMSTTIASPSSGDSVIAVTAFTTRNTWPNYLGQTSFYSDNPVLQDFYEASSLGPRLDGQQRPDVAAPGEGIVSSLAIGVAGTAGNSKVDDGVHWILRGTSMSAAHVAGALALLLQQKPHMSPSAARNLIRSKIRSDGFTQSVPNAKWGYGKLDLKSTIVAVGDGPRGAFGLAPAWPNPTRGMVHFEFDLSSADVAEAGDGGIQLSIFDPRGRLVATVPGSTEPGPQRVVWSGLTDRGLAVPAGVYLARLEVGTHSAVTKFVRLAP